jgi:hypothetical protein
LTGQLTFKPKLIMKDTNTITATRTETALFASPGVQYFSAQCQAKMEGLKTRLVSKLSLEFPEVRSQLVRQAVLEAHALASLTTVPQLFLPTLAEEKVIGLRNWTLHQKTISRHPSLALAA